MPFLALLALEGAFAGALLTRVRQVLGAVERRGRDLAMLANVLARLERASFTSPRLRELRARLVVAWSGDHATTGACRRRSASPASAISSTC